MRRYFCVKGKRDKQNRCLLWIGKSTAIFRKYNVSTREHTEKIQCIGINAQKKKRKMCKIDKNIKSI